MELLFVAAIKPAGGKGPCRLPAVVDSFRQWCEQTRTDFQLDPGIQEQLEQRKRKLSARPDLRRMAGPAKDGTGTSAGYVNPGTNSIRTIPGVSCMSPAVVQMRVWDCGFEAPSCEDAITNAHFYAGESAPLNLPQVGFAWSPTPLVGLQAFCVSAGLAEWGPPGPGFTKD